MTLIIFGVGVLVFFLTVYGTVVAGGLRLTKQQLETSQDLAPELIAKTGDSDTGLPIIDVVKSDF